MNTEGKIIGACGPPRSGKTDLLLRAICKLPPNFLRVAVDRMGDFPDELSDGTVPDYRYVTLKRLNLIRWLGIERLNRDGIIYTLAGRAESAALSWCLRNATRERPICLFIDEMGQWKDGSRHRIADQLSDYVAGRRHTGLTVVWGCQYPRQIHYSLISMSDGMLLFGMADKSDISKLAEGGISESMCERVRALGVTFQAALESGGDLPHTYLWAPKLQPTPEPLDIEIRAPQAPQ